MKRIIMAVSLVLLAGVVGVGWRQWRQGRNATEAAGAALAENARTRAAIRAVEQRLATAERKSVAPTTALAASPEADVESAALSAKGAEVAAAFKAAQERERDPKVQAIRLASWRAQWVTSHGAFFRQRGLTPAQIEKFQDIAARRSEQNVDLDGILESEAEKKKSVSPETKAVVEKLRDQMKAEAETAQKALLGEEGYRRCATTIARCACGIPSAIWPARRRWRACSLAQTRRSS